MGAAVSIECFAADWICCDLQVELCSGDPFTCVTAPAFRLAGRQLSARVHAQDHESAGRGRHEGGPNQRTLKAPARGRDGGLSRHMQV